MTPRTKKPALPKDAAKGKRFAIVASRYHEDVIQALMDGAVSTLEKHGARDEDITTVWVPGSFEIPLAARALLAHREPDAVLCLGVIIKGETPHNEYIAQAVTEGIAALSHQTGVPVLFGILTTDTLEQAKARSGGNRGHKGVEAAEAALSMIHTLDEIKKGPKKASKNVGF